MPSSIRALHPQALLGAGGVAEDLERLLQTSDLALGLGEVLLERSPEFLGRRGFRHLRKGLRDLPLGAQQVSELIDQQILQGSHRHFLTSY